MNIYIGNFSPEVTGDDLKEAFGPFGHVESVAIIKDKFTGDSRGFGFVVMLNKKEAQAAIDGIKEIKGQMVTINEARPQVRNQSGGGRRGGYGNNNFSRREKRHY